MSLVTKENAHERPGWVVAPLGRIVRPMKMRPLRPLTDMDAKSKELKKRKSGATDPRARRRRIDMLKYGSVHLKGVFVDLVVPNLGSVGPDEGNVLLTTCKEGVPSTRSEVADENEMEIDEKEPSVGDGEDEEGSEDHLEESESGIENEVSEGDYSEVQEEAQEPTKASKASTRPSTKLKDLFVPQDENGPPESWFLFFL
jgi:hypothetical protein